MKRRNFIAAAIGGLCAMLGIYRIATPEELEFDQPELEYNGVKIPKFALDKDGNTCRLHHWKATKCEDVFRGGVVITCRVEYRPVKEVEE